MAQQAKLKNNLTASMDQNYTSYVEEIRPDNLYTAIPSVVCPSWSLLLDCSLWLMAHSSDIEVAK